MTLLSGVLDAEIALAFVTADLDGRITAFGRGAERMLGLDATAMVGTPLAEVCGLARPDLLAAAAAGDGSDPVEVVLTRADGRHVEVRRSVAPVRDDAGAITGYLVIAADITGDRQRERGLEALRRVAMAVAAGDAPDLVFSLVAREAAALVGASLAGVARFEGREAVEVGGWSAPGVAGPALGARTSLDEPGVLATVAADGDHHASRGGPPPLPPRAARWPDPRGEFGVLAAPVNVAGPLWGALWVAAEEPAWRGGDELESLTRFSDLVAVAIARADAREWAVTEALADAFTSDRDLGDHLRMIAASALRAMGAVRTTIYRSGEDGAVAGVFTTETDPAIRAYLADDARRDPRVGHPLWSTVADPDGQRLVEIPDLRSDPRIPAEWPERTRVRAIVARRLEHPLLHEDGVPVMLGALVVGYGAPHILSARERVALESLSGIAAMALANERLAGMADDRTSATLVLSERDHLTGLLNHRAFQERLRAAVDRAEREGRELALALIDIDRFRRVNEIHGHARGDSVLRAVCRSIESVTAPGDTLGRVGGEEIAWLMERRAMDAWRAADDAREAVAASPVAVVGQVTVSVGVCDLRRARGDQDLMRLAEGALYWAKQHGRNVAFLYSPDVVEVLSAEDRAENLARSQALQSIRVLARAVDARDPSTRRHSERVSDLAVALATSLGWDTELLVLLREAGLVHDVGKIGVPDAILFKAGRLTPEEYGEITRHATIGARMVADVLTPEQVAWVRGHHERWDGGGYPDGLAGVAIPEGARILALADAWDVMTSKRAYQEPRSTAEALEECRRHSGTQFSPEVVRALEQLVSTDAVPWTVGRGSPEVLRR